MSAPKFPTGLPLVDKLRSCMLQNVPDNQTAGRCSSLPYDAAEVIHDLYDALDWMLLEFGSDIKAYDGELYHRAYDSLARVRGELS